MDILKIVLFILIVAVSYLIEGIIGFGGTIIALPIASLIVDIKLTVPVLTAVILVASSYIAIRDFKYIAKKEFAVMTLLMLIGLPFGMWFFTYFPEKPLKICLGIFMIFVSVKGLLFKQNESGKSNNKYMNILYNIVLVMGGIIHGAFACGGPFVVIYASNKIKDKTRFRATLCALWAMLNLIMLVVNLAKGDLTSDFYVLTLWAIPFIILSAIIANKIHKKVNEKLFEKVIYIVLLGSSITMFL